MSNTKLKGGDYATHFRPFSSRGLRCMTPIYVLGTAILPRNDLGENTREVRLSTTHPVYGSVTNFVVVEGDITLRKYTEIIESLSQRIEEVAL